MFPGCERVVHGPAERVACSLSGCDTPSAEAVARTDVRRSRSSPDGRSGSSQIDLPSSFVHSASRLVTEAGGRSVSTAESATPCSLGLMLLSSQYV